MWTALCGMPAIALLVLATVTPAWGLSPAPTAAPTIVVVGSPGLVWTDVDARRMPTLDRLRRTGAAGVLSVKTAGRLDCAADAWLTLGAGNRARALGRPAAHCRADPPAVTSLPAQRELNDHRREGARPGLLADILNRSGSCVAADGDFARLGAADRGGAVATRCPVLLVQAPEPVDDSARAAVDALIGRLEAGRPPGSTLLVLGVSEGAGASTAHLHVALAVGPRFRSGGLVSASTRRPLYVQLVDVAPTILSLLDLPRPDAMTGQPWRADGGRPSLFQLRDADRQAVGQRRVTVPFFVALVAVQLVAIPLAAWRRRWREAEVCALLGTAVLGASYLANLLPWWRAGMPLVALGAVTACGAVVLALPALLLRGVLTRAGLVCGLVALVIGVDLLTGARLQLASVGGYSPLVAGRFAGIGNVAFGVLAAAVLLAAASTGSATIAALTALVVVVDGAPQWGSDVGGVLALVPAYAVLVLLLSGRAPSLRRVALAGLGGALVVAAFAIADHARPADQQTHLGRFVGQVLDGTAGGVLQRKAAANLGLLFHSPVTALLPIVVAVLLRLFLRPPAPLRALFLQSPAWRAGLLAVLTASGLGFVLNDSGAAVPALAILIAVPATVAVLARQARESASHR